jgi:DNA adenine methylase
VALGIDAPCPIPYQGSKRKLAPAILRCLPDGLCRLHEPFAGSAAISLAVAIRRPGAELRINDSNAALAALWREIIDHPQQIAEEYAALWTQQLGRPREFYDEVRDRFNATGRPDLFLYLLARCVKAAVRYNGRGEFNQSPDNRRLGSRPERMARHIAVASALLRGRARVTSLDFRAALIDATPDDVIYLDPPYQGVSKNHDRRYADIMGYDDLVNALRHFNDRNLSFIVSYDGRTGERTYGKALPETLRLRRYEIDAGRSTQSTLAGGADRTVESLYLSPALEDRLGLAAKRLLPRAGLSSWSRSP